MSGKVSRASGVVDVLLVAFGVALGSWAIPLSAAPPDAMKPFLWRLLLPLAGGLISHWVFDFSLRGVSGRGLVDATPNHLTQPTAASCACSTLLASLRGAR